MVIGNSINSNASTGVDADGGTVVPRNSVTNNGTNGVLVSASGGVGEVGETGHSNAEISGLAIACNSVDGVQAYP